VVAPETSATQAPPVPHCVSEVQLPQSVPTALPVVPVDPVVVLPVVPVLGVVQSQ